MNAAGDETRKRIIKALLATPASTVPELVTSTGKSKTAVKYQLMRMEEEGFIRDEVCACCGAEIKVVVMAWPK